MSSYALQYLKEALCQKYDDNLKKFEKAKNNSEKAYWWKQVVNTEKEIDEVQRLMNSLNK